MGENIRGSKVLVIGKAVLIGSCVVDELVREDVSKVVIYDNFTSGAFENVEEELGDPRVRFFEPDGDILHTDILNNKTFYGVTKIAGEHMCRAFHARVRQWTGT